MQASIRELAQDPVCDIRMQIVQNVYILRDGDPEWMWNEIERVVQHEYTRTVVGCAIESLARVAYLDIPRAIRIAKLVFTRYDSQDGPGIGHVCKSAGSLIMDIHLSFSNNEANRFYLEHVADPACHVEIMHHWVARYSENLVIGDHTGSERDRLRARTIAFYQDCAGAVSDELATLYAQYDLAKSQEWPPDVLMRVQALNGVLEGMARCIYSASGGHIPRSRDNPELRWVDDTKIVGYLIAVCGPVPWHVVAEEIEHRGAEFPERGVTLVVCDVPVHQAP